MYNDTTVIQIEPLGQPLDASVEIQGSKYIANRVLPIAAFAKSQSQIKNMPQNEDVQTAIEGLRNLGANFKEKDGILEISPIVKKRPLKTVEPFVHAHDSGTFARFISPLLTLSEDYVELLASKQMMRRPMKDLFDSLEEMGASIESNDGFLPAKIKGPVVKDEVRIDSGKSSQFISSLMILAPHLKSGLTVYLEGKTVSFPYILMTKNILERFGIIVDMGEKDIRIKHHGLYSGTSYTIPTDPVSASYFFLLAAITEGRIKVANYSIDELQKESVFPKILERMGCSLQEEGSSLILKGGKTLNPIDVSLSETPDIAPSLVVACMYAEGESILRDLGHLRYKESDRLNGCLENLKKMGVRAEIKKDDLHIVGCKPTGAIIDPKGDHRMAMSFAIAGFKTGGVSIANPHCVAKSFPEFWNVLKNLGLRFRGGI